MEPDRKIGGGQDTRYMIFIEFQLPFYINDENNLVLLGKLKETVMGWICSMREKPNTLNFWKKKITERRS